MSGPCINAITKKKHRERIFDDRENMNGKKSSRNNNEICSKRDLTLPHVCTFFPFNKKKVPFLNIYSASSNNVCDRGYINCYLVIAFIEPRQRIFFFSLFFLNKPIAHSNIKYSLTYIYLIWLK